MLKSTMTRQTRSPLSVSLHGERQIEWKDLVGFCVRVRGVDKGGGPDLLHSTTFVDVPEDVVQGVDPVLNLILQELNT